MYDGRKKRMIEAREMGPRRSRGRERNREGEYKKARILEGDRDMRDLDGERER